MNFSLLKTLALLAAGVGVVLLMVLGMLTVVVRVAQAIW